MEKHTGIVIKTLFTKKRKMIVIDHYLGKIEAIPDHERIHSGSLLYYERQAKGTHHFLRNIEIINVPLDLAKHDILFLHHILEICYYCASFENKISQTFDLLLYLYNDIYRLERSEFKIIFVFKLLASLGMHPAESEFQHSLYKYFTSESIDTILNKPIDLNTTKILYDWIQSSLWNHPLINIFKTMQFLEKNRLS